MGAFVGGVEHEDICAIATRQCVLTQPTIQRVTARPAAQQIIIGPTIEEVITQRPLQRVIIGPTKEPVIAGTTIGAGILALPAATQPAGLLPSSLLLITVRLDMAAAGF